MTVAKGNTVSDLLRGIGRLIAQNVVPGLVQEVGRSRFWERAAEEPGRCGRQGGKPAGASLLNRVNTQPTDPGNPAWGRGS